MPDDPESEKDPMTAAQREAVQKAYTILTEHFDRMILVVDFDIDEPDGKMSDAHEGYWHGGSMSGIGLAEFAKDRILNSGRKHNDPTDED